MGYSVRLLRKPESFKGDDPPMSSERLERNTLFPTNEIYEEREQR